MSKYIWSHSIKDCVRDEHRDIFSSMFFTLRSFLKGGYMENFSFRLLSQVNDEILYKMTNPIVSIDVFMLQKTKLK